MKLVLCKWAGCNQFCVHYYCQKHEAIAKKKREEQLKLFTGKRKKSAEYNNLYHTTLWKNLRKKHLEKNPYCVMCGALATVVDHIKAHQGKMELFTNENNLQSFFFIPLYGQVFLCRSSAKVFIV